MPVFSDRLKHAWNAFMNKDPTDEFTVPYTQPGAVITSTNPAHIRMSRGNERSIVTAIYNRIAMDVASVEVKHVRLDEKGRYKEEILSGLDNCLTLSANKDQTSRAFIQDVVMSMFDEGMVAIVPTDTTLNPKSGTFDILEMRTGRILQWYPNEVKVRVFNERLNKYENLILQKSTIGIIENPFYAIMNDKNSVVKQLVHKLNLLDVIDEQASAGKLDLLIQLPYVIKNEQRRQQAEERRKDIERQLSNTKYGIAYTDGTEHVTQLNRPVENNLMKQIEYLTNMAYAQLGISQSILDGTADEKAMLNYNNRIIEPLISVIVDEMKRKFLTKTARSQRQSILFFRDPFRLAPIDNIAEIADKFTRNEIMTSNEFRQEIGMLPSDDPSADELRNKNLSESKEELQAKMGTPKEVPKEGEIQNGKEV